MGLWCLDNWMGGSLSYNLRSCRSSPQSLHSLLRSQDLMTCHSSWVGAVGVAAKPHPHMLCKQWHCPPGVLDTSSHLSFSSSELLYVRFPAHTSKCAGGGQLWDLCVR